MLPGGLDASRIGGIGIRWLLDGRLGLEGRPTRSTLQEVGGFGALPQLCFGNVPSELGVMEAGAMNNTA